MRRDPVTVTSVSSCFVPFGRWLVRHWCALGSVGVVAMLWRVLLPAKSDGATWCETLGWVEFYDGLEQGSIGQAVGQSLWLFPVIEIVHLLGLAVLGGSILVVDLRLLGVGLKGLPPGQVHANARPWFVVGLVVMLATGIPLFLSEAIKCCFSHSFEVKITALIIALAFTLAVRNRIASGTNVSSHVAEGVAVLSLGIWFTVAAAGRWIGFSG